MSKTFKQRIPRGFVWQKNHSIAYPFYVDSIAAKSKFLGQANSLTFTILKKFCSFHGTPLVYINSIYYFDELSIAFFMPAQTRLRPKADHLRGTQAAEIFFKAQSQRDPQPVIRDVIGKERAAENQLSPGFSSSTVVEPGHASLSLKPFAVIGRTVLVAKPRRAIEAELLIFHIKKAGQAFYRLPCSLGFESNLI